MFANFAASPLYLLKLIFFFYKVKTKIRLFTYLELLKADFIDCDTCIDNYF